jgi:hypothetical protein
MARTSTLFLALTTLLFGCGESPAPEAPSPQAEAEQAPAAEAAPAPPEKKAAAKTPRTVVTPWNSEPDGATDRWEAMVCKGDSGWVKTCDGAACEAKCPQEGKTITVAPAKAGPVTLHTGEGSFAMEKLSTSRYERYLTQTAPTSAVSTGKTVTEMPLPNAQYTKSVGEAVGKSDPGLIQLLKIDLEGDGVDEVLFAANVRGVKELAEPEGDATDVAVWSYVGIRRVIGDEVKTILLTEWTGESSYEELMMGRPGTYVHSEVSGFTDANGDGTLEVVIDSSGDHSVWSQVMTIDGEKVKELGGSK